MWTVYILKCSDGKFYTGCTSNLEDRMKRHHGGEVLSTKNRLPVMLVTYIVNSELTASSHQLLAVTLKVTCLLVP